MVHQAEEGSVEELAGTETDTRSRGECDKCKQQNCQDCEIRTGTYGTQDTDPHIQSLSTSKMESMYTGEEVLNKWILAQGAKDNHTLG